MQIFKPLKIMHNDVLYYTPIFGFSNAIKLRVLPKLYSVLGNGSYYHFYNNTMIELLKKEFKDIIEKYRNIEKTIEKPFDKSSTIWVCWWQGEDQMPTMIKKCFYSLCKNNNAHKVILLTKDTYPQIRRLIWQVKISCESNDFSCLE